jgi:hypothetical protein
MKGVVAMVAVRYVRALPNRDRVTGKAAGAASQLTWPNRQGCEPCTFRAQDAMRSQSCWRAGATLLLW